MNKFTDAERAEILERVADGYESGRYDWTKGSLVRIPVAGTPKYCLVGAINHELGESNLTLLQCGTVDSYIYERAEKIMVGMRCQEIYRFNDLQASMDTVIELVKEQAKDLRNRAGESRGTDC